MTGDSRPCFVFYKQGLGVFAQADGLKLIEETKEFLVEQGLAKKDYAIKDWLTN
jgi:hypothetical protein